MKRELAISLGMLYLEMKDGETKEEAINRLIHLIRSVGVDYNCYDKDEAEIREI